MAIAATRTTNFFPEIVSLDIYSALVITRTGNPVLVPLKLFFTTFDVRGRKVESTHLKIIRK